ncbi:hypothetical protein MRY16398_25860 [Phytobacter sp. MRY16-398]|nr:hypothetical protein MRY16398_25860 [Phytobacter sp. MRY16-398]
MQKSTLSKVNVKKSDSRKDSQSNTIFDTRKYLKEKYLNADAEIDREWPEHRSVQQGG